MAPRQGGSWAASGQAQQAQAQQQPQAQAYAAQQQYYAAAQQGAPAQQVPQQYAAYGEGGGAQAPPYVATAGPAAPVYAAQGGGPPSGGYMEQGHTGGGGGFGMGGGGGWMPPLSPRSLATMGLGAYGEKLMQGGQSFSNKYLSTTATRGYFNVTPAYVANKLKVVLCPFTLRGSWARIPEQVAGGLTYKPPRNDINAPDLYLPSVGFAAYCVMCAVVAVTHGKFSPEMLHGVVSRAAFAWGAYAGALWVALRMLATAHVPLSVPMLDLVAYAGYPFVLLAANTMLGFMLGGLGYYALLVYCAVASAVFVVKTFKRILFSESRHYGMDSSKHNYVLLALALCQLPFFSWMGSH